jgi:hypothetical protein
MEGERKEGFGGIVYVGLAAIFLGVSFLSGMGKKEDKTEYPLDEHAVPSSMLPHRLYNGSVDYADVDRDEKLESFYVWNNPDGYMAKIPMILGDDGTIEYPTLSKRSLNPLEIPKSCCGQTYFIDVDSDGDTDAVYFLYDENTVLVMPLIKPQETAPRSYLI